MGLASARRRPRPGSWTSSTRTCSAGCGWSRCSRASTRATSRWSPSAAPDRCTPTRLGRLTGAWPVIVPPSPGVLCALGDATTAKRSESARTVLRRFADLLTGDDLATILGELADEAGGRLAEQGVDRGRPDHDLPGRRALPRAGLRDRHRRRPGLAGRPGRRRWTQLAARVRRRARAAVLLPARHRPRAGQRPGHGVRAAPGGGADPAGRRRRRSGRGAGGHPPDPPVRPARRAGERLRPDEAAGRRRGHRTGDRHRDGLDHPGAARARGHRAPVRQPAHRPSSTPAAEG